MKVLLVNGSSRKNGCTLTALNEAAKALNEEGVETEFFFIGNEALPDCIACRKCVKAAPEVFNPQGFLVRATKPELVDEALVKSAGCPTGALQTVEEHLALGQTQKNDKEGAA